jgi:hypothetical protein
MRLSNKRRGVLGQWTTIIALALLLAFLVSVVPVSCGSTPSGCADTCLNRLQTTHASQCEAYKVCIWWENGVQKSLWRKRCRDCVTKDTWQDCYHQVRCTANGLCEQQPQPYLTKKVNTQTTCGSWGPWTYWTT